MKQKLSYLLRLFLFWICYFIIARSIFLLYNLHASQQLELHDILGSFLHGIKLDISMTGYILFFTLILVTFTFFLSNNIQRIIYRTLNYTLIVLFSIITIVDIELYLNWGFRIDSTIFLYLKTPKESMASTPIIKSILLFLATVVLCIVSICAYKKHIDKALKNKFNHKWYWNPVFLFMTALMILPIRGGIGIAPINQGTVYFSQNQYANHAAINAIWNLAEAISSSNKKQTISFMDDEKAEQIFNQLNAKPNILSKTQLIKNGKNNVLIIILESFTSNIIEPLGGVVKASPNFTKLAKEGVLFTNCYASGERSDKGIASILSGYPAQPTTSIINYNGKSAKLPHLSKAFMQQGYSSAFYYGGDINFANMKSYFISGTYEKLVTENDFPASERTSKWGVHDHLAFNKVLSELNQTRKPFFSAFFTLSSHEPFDVPHKSQFNDNNIASLYLNSINYTDSCLGDFIDKAKLTDWWNNTLIVLVADHGTHLPKKIQNSVPEKFEIPMLWLGGAVIKDTCIHSVCSQIDIPLMIANQLNFKINDFNFSKDVLSGQHGYAYYAYNNGFGFFENTSGLVWDNTSNSVIANYNSNSNTEQKGKAFFQMLLKDFNSK